MTETEFLSRLERLERDNRRLKGFGIAALGLATALATIYAMRLVPYTITAHQFEVVDNSGRVRATMRIDGMALMDAQGNPRVDVTVTPTGATIWGDKITAHQFDVMDKGKVRATMGMAAGEPSVWLNDTQGNARAEMSIGPFGGPGIYLYDAQGHPVADLNVIPSVGANIWLTDTQGFEMDLESMGKVNGR